MGMHDTLFVQTHVGVDSDLHVKLERACGILLHPTSLPSRYGIGDLGPAATRYLDWLADCGIGWWQVLPLHPVGPGNSPYSGRSTFAGNPLLISPELLVQDELLEAGELEPLERLPADQVDYEQVLPLKRVLLERAAHRFHERASAAIRAELERYLETEGHWLDDYALYAALKRAHAWRPWYEWPAELAQRRPAALRAWRAAHADAIAQQQLQQFLFDRQWGGLRRQAAARGLRILGDLPLFVAYDSAEVWASRELFKLDREGRPKVVAGVPPDYFSASGQRWGNPMYDWNRLGVDGYAWFLRRLRRVLSWVDAVRLDHFRGYMAAWEIPADSDAATGGRWVPGPGRRFFEAVRQELGGLPLVAEDLGTITDDVIALREAFDLPGMAILQFAFRSEHRSDFLPYQLRRDTVVYTGTHDNNTSRGWYDEDASEEERDLARRYMASDGREIHWDLIRLALASVAVLAILPHQDLAGLGSAARMNTPGAEHGNWRFRLSDDLLTGWHRNRLAELISTYGRNPAWK
jgi:4-alpha-glucanotransferase